MVIEENKVYAIVEDGIVTNIVVATKSHAESQGLIDIEGHSVDIGYIYDGSSFYEDPEIIAARLEKTIENIRRERDGLLEATDWWMMPDRTPTQEQLDYRQALRDIPQQEGFPENITWPIKPE